MISNLTCVDIIVDDLELLTEEVEVSTVPLRFILNANRKYVETSSIQFRPLKPGKLAIVGIAIKVGNFKFIHKLDSDSIDHHYKQMHKDYPWVIPHLASPFFIPPNFSCFVGTGIQKIFGFHQVRFEEF